MTWIPACLSSVRTLLPLAITWGAFAAQDMSGRTLGFLFMMYGAVASERVKAVLADIWPGAADDPGYAMWSNCISGLFLLASWWCLDWLCRRHKARRRRRLKTVEDVLGASRNRRAMRMTPVDSASWDRRMILPEQTRADSPDQPQQPDVWHDCPDECRHRLHGRPRDRPDS